MLYVLNSYCKVYNVSVPGHQLRVREACSFFPLFSPLLTRESCLQLIPRLVQLYCRISAARGNCPASRSLPNRDFWKCDTKYFSKQRHVNFHAADILSQTLTTNKFPRRKTTEISKLQAVITLPPTLFLDTPAFVRRTLSRPMITGVILFTPILPQSWGDDIRPTMEFTCDETLRRCRD